MRTERLPAQEVRLPARAIHAIGDAAHLRIACTAGTLWITLDNDTRDIVLEAGEAFVVKEHRKALVYALGPARFCLRRLAAPAAAAAPAWWRALWPAGRRAATPGLPHGRTTASGLHGGRLGEPA